MSKLRIIALSDTHNYHKKVIIPPCDILIHAGDFTSMGYKHEVEAFAKWLDDQPADNIVLCPGNHEKTMEKCLTATEFDKSSRTWITDHCPRANLLIHEACEIEGIKFFGSPWTPYFFNWAWNAGRTIAEAEHYSKPFIGDLWSDIPEETQFLITHGMPYGILDDVQDWNDVNNRVHVGCEELLKRIKQLPNLKYVVGGHLHREVTDVKSLVIEGVTYINASICNNKYKPLNPAVEIKYV